MYDARSNSSKGNATQASIEPVEDEDAVYVEDFLRVIWRRLWVIALVALLVTAAAAGLSLSQPPQYEASIKILVGQEQEQDGDSSLGSDVIGLQRLTETVAEVLPTRPVAEEVIQRLDLETTPGALLENVSVEQIAETQVVEVSYRDTDPERAQRVADDIGEVFSEQVADVSPNTNAITATVWERAAVPASPVSPNPVRNGILALVLGSVLGLGLALLLEQLDDRWRSSEEVERASGVPTFGVVRTFEAPRAKTNVGKGEG